MNMQDVGWKILLVQWLERRPEADKELLTGFCDVYIQKTIDYLLQCCQPHMFGSVGATIPQYKRVIPHTMENMITTFSTLLEVNVNLLIRKQALVFLVCCLHDEVHLCEM